MESEYKNGDEGDNYEYVPMEKRAVKKAAKGCLYLLAIPAAIFVIVLIDLLLSRMGHPGSGGIIIFVVSGIWCLFGLFTLVFWAPREIISEAKQLGSMGKGFFSILAGVIIAIVWIAIITRHNPSGLKPGITSGHLIQWGIILIVCHFFSRGLWRLFRPKYTEEARPVRSPRRKPAQSMPKSKPAAHTKSEPKISKVPEEKIGEPAEMIEVLNKADETLYQSNNPDDEVNLAKRLMESPEEAIRAIEHRGWKKRGKAEETNRFVIRVLSKILNEGEEAIKEKALEALVKIFATPDDNTTGWVGMLEQSAGVIAKSKMPGAKDKLESLRSKVSGKNLEAIDYALNLLKSS